MIHTIFTNLIVIVYFRSQSDGDCILSFTIYDASYGLYEFTYMMNGYISGRERNEDTRALSQGASFLFRKTEMIVEIRMKCTRMATPRCSKEGIMFDYFPDM
jgi:hypothetical protein